MSLRVSRFDVLLIGSFLIVSSVLLAASSLRLEDVETAPGGTVAVSLLLTHDDKVTGFTVNVEFESGFLVFIDASLMLRELPRRPDIFRKQAPAFVLEGYPGMVKE